MYRNPQVIQRPSSSITSPRSPTNHIPPHYPSRFSSGSSLIPHNQWKNSIPLNQSSSINFASRPNQSLANLRSQPNTISNLSPRPNTRKVYFTYIDPRSLQVTRQFIETIVQQTGHLITNEWQWRYYELEKQLNFFLIRHEKMTEEFLKVKDQLRITNEQNLRNQLQIMTKTQKQLDQGIEEIKEQKQSLTLQNAQLRIKFQYVESSANQLREENTKLKATIEKLQGQLIQSKDLTYQVEVEKNKLIAQIKQFEYILKQTEKESKSNTSDLIIEKNKLQKEIYELKMTIAQKNTELQENLIKINQLNSKCEELKAVQKPKTAQKQGSPITNQNYQQRLARIKNEYERREKRTEKLLEGKATQISYLSKYVAQIESQLRAEREMKEKFAKLHSQKDEQLKHLKNFQQNIDIEGDQDKIAFYEHKIQEYNKIALQQCERIKKLEEEKKKMQVMISQYEDNYVSQKQLTQLHNVIEQQKNKLLQKGGVNYDELSNKAHPYFNGKIFQEKLIYQLKKDNQKLMKMLKKINMHQQIPQPQMIINQNLIFNHQSGSSLSMTMKTMIADTFFKLQRISGNLKQKEQHKSQKLGRYDSGYYTQRSPKARKSRHSPQKSPHKSHKNFNQQAPFITKIQNDLQILKVYIVELSQTCQRLVRKLHKQQQNQQIIHKQQTQVLINQRQINNMIPKDQEIIQFYKNKNKDLQARVDQLLQLNNFLKAKLNQKHPQKENSGEEYWKNQVKKLNEEIQEITNRYRKLLVKFQQAQTQKFKYEAKIALYSQEIQRLHIQINEYEQKLSQNRP